MKNKVYFYVLAVFLFFQLSGCAGTAAFGRKADHSQSWPRVSYSSSEVVHVFVNDKRPSVKTGRRAETYVGVVRAGFGNPFEMHTESGAPLKDDIAAAVENGLNSSGIVGKKAEVSEFLQRATVHKEGVLLVIDIHQWESDTYTTTGFEYEISGFIYKKGVKVAEGSVKGEGTYNSAIDGGKEALSSLLNKKEISDFLSSRH